MVVQPSSRRLQALVQRIVGELGDERIAIDRCIATMRWVRGLPAADPIIDDPQVINLAGADDALGLLYQAMNAPKLEAAYRASARQRRKFTSAEIPAVTQLFTPRWVVEFLLQNTLGRIWGQWHPDSQVRTRWQWLLRRDESELPAPRALPPRRAIDLKVLDPACGTMNFGVVAIEMLDAMYREELQRAGDPGWPEPSVHREQEIAGSIARNNLFGIDIDPLALTLARATLDMKLPLAGAETWDLRCADALFDAAPTARGRGRGGILGFDVIVTNPPYLSARNLAKHQVARLKRRFPAGWRDQYACFIERGLDLISDGGMLGVLAMHSFMFTAAFERLRRLLAGSVAVESIAHFGGGLFDVGNPGTLQTAAITMRREPDEHRRSAQVVVAIRLVDADDKPRALSASLARDEAYRASQRELMTAAPRLAWSYWLTPAMRSAFAIFPRLRQVAPPRQGLATTHNARFVRCWWEVAPTSPEAPCRATADTWVAYVKSGRFRRWFEAPRHRVNWRDDGAQIKAGIVERYPYLNGQWQWVAKNAQHYFKAGVTWSYLTSGRFSARLMDVGAIFDVAGSALFPEDEPARLGVLGFLNSSVARQLLEAINPTVNFQVGDIGELPLPDQIAQLRSLHRDVARAIDLMRRLDAWDETSPSAVAPPAWRDAEEQLRSLRRELFTLEQRIDASIADLFHMPLEATRDEGGEFRFDRVEIARQWIAHALRDILRHGAPVRIVPPDRLLVRALRDRLDCADQIEQAVGGIDEFLANEFPKWHARKHARRPAIWALGTATSAHLVAHDFATREVVRSMLRGTRRGLPHGWQRRVDDGVTVNLAPLAHHVLDPTLRKALTPIAASLAEDFRWSDTFADCTTGATRAPTPAPALAARVAASPSGHEEAVAGVASAPASGLADLALSGRSTDASCAPIVHRSPSCSQRITL